MSFSDLSLFRYFCAIGSVYNVVRFITSKEWTLRTFKLVQNLIFSILEFPEFKKAQKFCIKINGVNVRIVKNFVKSLKANKKERKASENKEQKKPSVPLIGI